MMRRRPGPRTGEPQLPIRETRPPARKGRVIFFVIPFGIPYPRLRPWRTPRLRPRPPGTPPLGPATCRSGSSPPCCPAPGGCSPPAARTCGPQDRKQHA
eukprot:6059694-Pyramimonas_sp.AAC.1